MEETKLSGKVVVPFIKENGCEDGDQPFVQIDLGTSQVLCSQVISLSGGTRAHLCRTPLGRFFVWDGGSNKGRLCTLNNAMHLAHSAHATPDQFKEWFGVELPEA